MEASHSNSEQWLRQARQPGADPQARLVTNEADSGAAATGWRAQHQRQRQQARLGPNEPG